jgi:hypothetical protein
MNHHQTHRRRDTALKPLRSLLAATAVATAALLSTAAAPASAAVVPAQTAVFYGEAYNETNAGLAEEWAFWNASDHAAAAGYGQCQPYNVNLAGNPADGYFAQVSMLCTR